MNPVRIIVIVTISLLLLGSCATKAPTHDLPSAGNKAKPKWVGTHRAARDTIFVVIHLPEEKSHDMDQSIQKAQTELHALLVNEIEILMRDYWEEKGIAYSEDDKFKLLSALPLTLDQIMNHVEVTDGWEKNGDVAILCALDYAEIADVIITDMEIQGRDFRPFLKRRMDEISRRYQR